MESRLAKVEEVTSYGNFFYHDDPIIDDLPLVGAPEGLSVVGLDLDVVDVVALVGGAPELPDDLVDLKHSLL